MKPLPSLGQLRIAHFDGRNKAISATPRGVKQLGRMFRAERKLWEESISDVARNAGCAPTTLSNLENGLTQYPRWQTVCSIATALGYTITVVSPNSHAKAGAA